MAILAFGDFFDEILSTGDLIVLAMSRYGEDGHGKGQYAQELSHGHNAITGEKKPSAVRRFDKMQFKLSKARVRLRFGSRALDS
jgi:hypothetical protein